MMNKNNQSKFIAWVYDEFYIRGRIHMALKIEGTSDVIILYKKLWK